jgi:Flp pilus assembly protein TadD
LKPRSHKPSPAPRLWIFRLAALAGLPLLILGLTEAALRVAGFGYDTRLFQIQRVQGQDYFMNNEHFSDRFFPPELARWPSPIMMPVHKSPGTFRIFIMGESAAQGDPQPAYGAGRYLDVLLRERYPGVHFEVVNVAITAINSHVILPIARECARHEGDLWIIYMGNNEMVGPFGAATVFGSKAPPLAFVRLNLALQQTRIGQALMTLGRRLHKSKSAPAQWGGMQMFLGNQLPPGDPRKEQVYRNFAGNLRDILRAGLDGGAKILLNTVAVNLRDCPPFASLDPKPADAEFALGQSLLRAANLAAAHEQLQLACDDDALPFRADSRVNGLIRQASEKMAEPNLVLCDAARALEAEQTDGLCGQETFYEHVHFNFNGGYRLGLLWAQQTERFLPAEIKSRAQTNWASAQTCDDRLGLTAWNRADTIHAVIDRMQKPPLSNQSNNPWRVAALEAELHQTEQSAIPARRQAARDVYADAIRHAPDDYYLRENFGEFDEVNNDIKDAAEQWRQACQLMPQNPYGYFTEGQLLSKLGELGPARDAELQAIALHPRYAEAWLELGKIDASEMKLDAALEEYRRSAALQPSTPETWLCIGKALSLQKHSPEALTNFQHAVDLNPSYWEAHYALGGELGMHDHFSEARQQFLEVIRLQPNYPLGHLNLGVALLKLQDYSGARDQFGETLRLDPANKTARGYLATAESLEKRQP